MTDSFGGLSSYLKIALTNICLFTVLDIQATMFSRGRICVLDKDGNEKENDIALEKFANPNFSQSQQDFLYQHSFFKGTGNNVTRVISRKSSRDIKDVISFENLIPDQINYNEINKVSSFTFASSDIKKEKEKCIKYRIDGKDVKIPLSELLFFYDISNGLTVNSRYKSPSRIDAIRPAIANIDEAQRAKNINLKFSAKHLVSGKKQSSDDPMMEVILGKGESNDIARNVYNKDILVNPNSIDVHSLAVDFSKLLYDDSLASDMLKISNTYGQSKDVLNWALNGASTHENQKTAVVDWIQNTIQFHADDTFNTYSNHFGYTERGERIAMKFDHLPIMQILEEKRMDSMVKKIEISEGLIRLGKKPEEALKEVGL